MSRRHDEPSAVRGPQPQLGGAAEPERAGRRARFARWFGPVAAVLTYLLAPVGEDALTEGGRATAAVAVLMAIWWVGETLPLAVTSLLPIVLLPLTGALGLAETTTAYGNPLVFLFLGGFVLALAMQRWGLHRRIALLTIRAVGTEPRRMIGGFMLATAGLSMWVSNTATTVMMLPIGVSVLALVASRLDTEDNPATTDTAEMDADPPAQLEPGVPLSETSPTPNLAVGLMLGIAYAASIGSLATLIGTPPNTFLAGFLQQNYGIELGFARWMMMALPLSVVFLVIAWVVITRWLYPPEIQEVPGGSELISDELAELGALGTGERNVLLVFVTMATLWIFRSPLQDLLDGTPLAAIDDAIIAIGGAIVLFALPVDAKRGVFTMDWETAKQLPWGVLLLFGGGLALAAAVSGNGVDLYVGSILASLSTVPVLLIIAIVAVTVLLLTELTSNTATTAALVPVVAGAAVVLELDPMVLAIPAALAASSAFALPVATPPNAIVFGSGHVTIPQMVRAGIVLNVIGSVLIVITAVTMVPLVFGV
ncbi:MAG: DASS family sodium-coupled anion symporter [Intrasporangiaceae bacterium]|nr:DASS family sodium-coupled anion symporter [Intrasporangiaceae bacterium]